MWFNEKYQETKETGGADEKSASIDYIVGAGSQPVNGADSAL